MRKRRRRGACEWRKVGQLSWLGRTAQLGGTLAQQWRLHLGGAHQSPSGATSYTSVAPETAGWVCLGGTLVITRRHLCDMSFAHK